MVWIMTNFPGNKPLGVLLSMNYLHENTFLDVEFLIVLPHWISEGEAMEHVSLKQLFSHCFLQGVYYHTLPIHTITQPTRGIKLLLVTFSE